MNNKEKQFSYITNWLWLYFFNLWFFNWQSWILRLALEKNIISILQSSTLPFHFGQPHWARIAPSLTNLSQDIFKDPDYDVFFLPMSRGYLYHKRIFIFFSEVFRFHLLKVFPQSCALFFLEWQREIKPLNKLKQKYPSSLTSWCPVCIARVLVFHSKYSLDISDGEAISKNGLQW